MDSASRSVDMADARHCRRRTVRGTADPARHEPVEFREKASGQLTGVASVASDGEFNLHLPEGHYDVRQGSVHTSVTVLPGGQYHLDLRREHVLDFKVVYQDAGHNKVVVRVSAEGAGSHTFAIRADNLILHEPAMQKIELTSGNVQELIWHADVVSAETPWVAILIPDGSLSERREITGTRDASQMKNR